MVRIHMKKSEDHQFLYEARCQDSVDETIRHLVIIHNLRLRIGRLKLQGEELAKHGPSKPVDQQGLDDEVAGLSLSDEMPPSDRGPFYCADPTGYRTGEACDPEVAKVLIKTLEEASACASKDKVGKGEALTKAELEEAIRNVRGAVMICYPMGLPAYDPVEQALTDTEELEGSAASLDVLDPATAQLWWAGKELLRERVLSDYVGKNDKTRIVAKLQKKGGGMPSREPPVDAETQKAMMSWYFKKQQEAKDLADDNDDSYTNSAWANPKALKSHFHGISNIRLR